MEVDTEQAPYAATRPLNDVLRDAQPVVMFDEVRSIIEGHDEAVVHNADSDWSKNVFGLVASLYARTFSNMPSYTPSLIVEPTTSTSTMRTGTMVTRSACVPLVVAQMLKGIASSMFEAFVDPVGVYNQAPAVVGGKTLKATPSDMVFVKRFVCDVLVQLLAINNVCEPSSLVPMHAEITHGRSANYTRQYLHTTTGNAGTPDVRCASTHMCLITLTWCATNTIILHSSLHAYATVRQTLALASYAAATNAMRRCGSTIMCAIDDSRPVESDEYDAYYENLREMLKCEPTAGSMRMLKRAPIRSYYPEESFSFECLALMEVITSKHYSFADWSSLYEQCTIAHTYGGEHIDYATPTKSRIVDTTLDITEYMVWRNEMNASRACAMDCADA